MGIIIFYYAAQTLLKTDRGGVIKTGGLLKSMVILQPFQLQNHRSFTNNNTKQL